MPRPAAPQTGARRGPRQQSSCCAWLLKLTVEKEKNVRGPRIIAKLGRSRSHRPSTARAADVAPRYKELAPGTVRRPLGGR